MDKYIKYMAMFYILGLIAACCFLVGFACGFNWQGVI